MRARGLAGFALGFAAGVLFLGVALWMTGRLTSGTGTLGSASSEPAPAEPAPVKMPATAKPPAPVPKPAPPAPDASRSVAGEGAPRIAMPIKEIDPASLRDSFDDPRGANKHEALDIMAPRGTPVRAVAEGNVVKLFTSNQGGLTVYQFDNSRRYCFYYAHLDRYAPGLKEGTLLRKGDVLGYVGSTGDASEDAPHLHLAVFELGPEKLWWKGTPINPLPLLR